METTVLTPVVQWGFAGFAVVLLCIVVWQFSQLVTIQKETNAIIRDNTEAKTKLLDRLSADSTILIKIHEALLRRPCMLDEKRGVG